MGRDSAAGVLSLHLGSRCGRYSSDWPSLYLEMDCLDRASGHKQVRSKILLWQSLVSAAELLLRNFNDTHDFVDVDIGLLSPSGDQGIGLV